MVHRANRVLYKSVFLVCSQALSWSGDRLGPSSPCSQACWSLGVVMGADYRGKGGGALRQSAEGHRT